MSQRVVRRLLLLAYAAGGGPLACSVTDRAASSGDAPPVPVAPLDGSSDLDAPATRDATVADVFGSDAVPDADATNAFTLPLPPGFPKPIVPGDNPLTSEKIALGRWLFYDRRLSENQTYSCASCHEQKRAFTDGRALAVGSTGQVHIRSAMSLANVAYATTLSWPNPNLTKLEDQVPVPMFGTEPIVELGLRGHEAEFLARLRVEPRYQAMFPAAFPQEADPLSTASVIRAIASFERTLLSGSAPYDRYSSGADPSALSAAAIRGKDLFFGERASCFHCHNGFNFSDAVTFEGKPLSGLVFHNTGLYNIDGHGAYPPGNTGLIEFTQVARDMGRFKTPTLRNVEVTAPYMHDGSVATLADALDHYAAGGRTIPSGPYAGVGSTNPFKDGRVPGFPLTADEKSDLVEFLKSLTDQSFLTDPRYANPWAPDAGAGGDAATD